jgi:hypothetical protein
MWKPLTTVCAALCAMMCVVCPTVGYAQPAPPQHLQVRRVDLPVKVDGTLDEPIWQQATPIPLRYEWFPGNNTPASVETTVRVAYDRERLYVAFRATDPNPSAIRANLADRDVPFLDDTVGFMIDTFNDGRRAFQFRVNARGVQMDAVNSDVDGSEDWSWDAIWESASQVSADGYTVEVAVPFSSLRFPRTGGAQTWGFMASRDMPRSSRVRMRTTVTDRDRACLICQFDKLTGFDGLEAGRNLELDPTVTAARSDVRSPFPSGSFTSGEADYEAGLSARWSVSPNVVFSGTLNPDFYQVEADSAQLDLNNRFQLFFPEKRPFFLEGADLFSTPLDLVFTRTIADPRWGAKLTGKEGHHAFGVSVAQDAVTGIMLPGYESDDFVGLPERHISTIGRYRLDIGSRGSTIGALYAGREGDRYANRVGGVDANLRLSQADTLRLQVVGSHTEDPVTVEPAIGGRARRHAAVRGASYAVRYNHQDERWSWRLNTTGISPEFRADSGFMPQVGARFYSAGASRAFFGGTDRWFNQIVIGAGADRTEDWQGSRASWGCDLPIEYLGRLQMSFNYTPACNREYYQGRTYDNFRHNIGWSIRPSGTYSFGVNATLGGAVDFANARKADQTRIDVNGSFNLFGRLSGEAGHSYQALDVAGGRLFTANLTQAKVLLHLNLRTYIRAIVQYTDIDRTTGLYRFPVADQTRRVFTQWLFNYKVNPQTVVLLGYSDNAMGDRTIDLTRTNRTLFLKVGYAWLF